MLRVTGLLFSGLNLYQFNGSNPVAFTDPFGLAPCPPDNDCGWLTAALTLTGALIGGGLGGGLGLSCGPGAPACSAAGASTLSVKGAAAGAALGTALGVLFSKSQADAVAIAQSQVDHINGHLENLRNEPASPAARGWRKEVKAGITKVERQIKHMKRKAAEAWRKQVAEWRDALSPE